MKHSWIYSHEAGDDHVWKCAQCTAMVGFNKQGVGEPWASDTEYPKNIDDYADPKECPNTAADASTRELLQTLMKAVDVTSAALTGKLTPEEVAKLDALKAEQKQ